MIVVLFVAGHAVLSGAAAAAFAWRFGQTSWPVLAHAALVAEWDAVGIALLSALAAACPTRTRWARTASAIWMAATLTLQVYLYVLDLVSNLSWGRNISGALVAAFAPTVWSGRETFPVAPVAVRAFIFGVPAVLFIASHWWSAPLDNGVRALIAAMARRLGSRARGPRTLIAVGSLIVIVVAFAMTLRAGIASQDLPWKTELLTSFFRLDVVGFAPTARRHAAAERDRSLRAVYPRHVAAARRKNVILIIVDSLRADHMQVYGYERETTPFLSRMVAEGRMKKVDRAFSTCSESFCGITSTLTSREFPDITADDFQLQDVLRDEGYQTWFLLSGNHRAWNGLPAFYRASDGTLFDGSDTRRYTMDDDRLVLEGLERVPAAASRQPAFFYIHLMSTHYLGVQLSSSHVFTRPDDQVAVGLEPYKELDELDKPDRYDDKVHQADDVIRQVLQALGAKRYLDDAIVAITGDHGEGLGERHWAHGWHLYNEDIRIPLLLFDVPAARYPDLSFAAQVDIAPTILDRLGLPVPLSWEGRSLLSPSRERFTFHQTYFLPNRFAVVRREGSGLFKYIATPQYGQEELYDLVRDPAERVNLAGARPDLMMTFRKKLSGYREEPRSLQPVSVF
jgi:glucan phosphoethanolaminetransferase (alkaline phosphatase superfamily)